MTKKLTDEEIQDLGQTLSTELAADVYTWILKHRQLAEDAAAPVTAGCMASIAATCTACQRSGIPFLDFIQFCAFIWKKNQELVEKND